MTTREQPSHASLTLKLLTPAQFLWNAFTYVANCSNSALYSSPLFPSSFTAINTPPSAQPQQLTPEATQGPISRFPTSSRPRNATVAEYLGLGCESESPTFDAFSPATLRKRKRVRKSCANTPTKRNVERSLGKIPYQQRVSDGLRVSKPSSRQVLTPKATQTLALVEASLAESSGQLCAPPVALSETSAHKLNYSHVKALEPTAALLSSDLPSDILTSSPLVYSTTSARDGAGLPVADFSQIHSNYAATPPSAQPLLKRRRLDLGQDPLIGAEDNCHNSTITKSNIQDNVDTARSEVLPNKPNLSLGRERAVDDFDRFEEFDDIFSTIKIDHATNDDTTNHQLQHWFSDTTGQHRNISVTDDEEFGDGIEDDDLLALGAVLGDVGTPSTSLYDRIPEKDSSRPARPAQRGPTSKFISPSTRHIRPAAHELNMTPIVRPPFPAPVPLGWTPVVGLSANCLLRTVFRIGEIINAASHVAKSGQNVLFELYARVLSSQRDTVNQHFIFGDLFHSNPPHLHGEYSATIWRGLELHETDSGFFLDQTKLPCRCIGKMKRIKKGWVIQVLNIFPAQAEDIIWVEGIVGA